MQKSKAITFRLSESEYEKVQKLAEQRHMNPTEYARHVALGNRIKPTIISVEHSSEEDISTLEKENTKMKQMIHSIQKHISENGFMNWHDYKNDEQAIHALKAIRNKKEE